MAKINLGSVVGPQGPQGPPGADGADGAQGIPGPNEISQETSVVGITSGHFFYNDNGKVKGKSITSNDIVDGAKKQSEINNEFSSAIGQIANDKQDKGFGIGEQIVSSEVNLNLYYYGGKFLTPGIGLLNIPDGWSADRRYNIDVSGGVSYCTQIISHDDAPAGSIGVIKTAIRFGKNMLSTPLWTPWKEISWAETPKETIITTGFASGWSGQITHRRNQEGKNTLFIYLFKNVDIGNVEETLYTLPSYIKKPRITHSKTITLVTTNGVALNVQGVLSVNSNGNIKLFVPSGQTLTGAKVIFYEAWEYYEA